MDDVGGYAETTIANWGERIMEEWRDISDYEGMYQVSNFGRVKSLARIMPHKIHGSWNIGERILKSFWSGQKESQYLAVFLHSGGGHQKIFKVHRLVAEAFIPRIDGKNVVNHKNCNRADNTVDNLEWVTAKENAQHAKDHGRLDNVGWAKRGVVNIDTGECFESVKAAAAKYEVTPRAIYQAATMPNRHCRGYRWKYADA